MDNESIREYIARVKKERTAKGERLSPTFWADLKLKWGIKGVEDTLAVADKAPIIQPALKLAM